MKDWKLRLGNAALAVGSLLAVLFTCEFATFAWLHYIATPAQTQIFSLYTEIPESQLLWSTHHYLNYVPRPNYSKGKTTHNAAGFRGKPFQLRKPAGTFRIVALGGSTTYTTDVEDDALTYPAQLEAALREDYGYSAVEVINAGVPGYNSWESLINLQFRVLDLEPDLVIFYEGTNDVHARLVLPDSYKGDNSGRRRQWSPPPIPWWERSALLRVISRKMGLTTAVGLEQFVTADSAYRETRPWENAVKMEPMRLLDQNPPVYFRRNLLSMVVVARAHGAEIMFATWPHTREWNDYAATAHYERGFEDNNRVMREVAQQYGVYLYDHANYMPTAKNFWHDGRHVNEAGARLQAQLFAAALDRSGLLHAAKAFGTRPLKVESPPGDLLGH